MPTSGDLSLYIHVPFCTKKCDYCHFFVVPNRESLQQDWFLSLKKEWELLRPTIEKHNILTLYFGGGTPSLLPPDWIAEIISWTKGQPKEITLEINPDDATPEKLKAFFKAGINRLSIGIQTFDDAQLLTLGRLHTSDKAKQTILDAYAAGFRNISCDLMYDLPNQTLQGWEKNLDIMASLPITHLSLYNLTIEPHTAFHRKKVQLPAPEISKQFYLTAIQKMTAAGFEHYEISAFCKNGLQSLHNTGYWLGRPFLGLGPSAFSYYEGKRYQNACSMSQYKSLLNEGKLPITFEEQLEPKAATRELFAIQLRLRQGISISSFKLEEETLSTLVKFEKLHWIENALSHPRLTQEGILFYDTIAEELI